MKRMNGEEMKVIEDKLLVFTLLKKELKEDFKKLKEMFEDVEAQKLAARILNEI